MGRGRAVSENFAADLEVSHSTTRPVESTDSQSRRERSDAAERGLIVVDASVLAWYAWAHWGDIQIDCGREARFPRGLGISCTREARAPER